MAGHQLSSRRVHLREERTSRAGACHAGVGSHVGVELGGVAFGVGAQPAVAPQLGVEQGALRAGVQRLSPRDEAGALGPVGEVDAVGELRDLGALGWLAVASQRRLPRAAVEAVVVSGAGASWPTELALYLPS